MITSFEKASRDALAVMLMNAIQSGSQNTFVTMQSNLLPETLPFVLLSVF